MQTQFYVSHNSQDQGPYSKGEIEKLLDRGEIFSHDYVFVEAIDDWVLVEEFLGRGRRALDVQAEKTQKVQQVQTVAKAKVELKEPAAQPPTVNLEPYPTASRSAEQFPIQSKGSFSASEAKTPVPDIRTLETRFAEAMSEKKSESKLEAKAEIKQDPKRVVSKIETLMPEQKKSEEKKPEQAKLSGWMQEKSPEKYPDTSAQAKHKTSSQLEDKRVEDGVIRFSHGEAAVSIRNHRAGSVEVSLVDNKKLGLDLSTKKSVFFIAAPAKEILCEGSAEAVVGTPLKLNLKAVDEYGNVDENFSGVVRVDSSSRVEGLGPVTFKHGIATHELKSTKADSIELRFESQGLKTPTTKKVHFRAAPASRVIIETPEKVEAGQEAMVVVKAVDEFGNLDVNFNETLTVRLSGAVSKEVEVRLTSGSGTVRTG